MTVRLQLAGAMADCPRCWENFVNHCQQTGKHSSRWEVPDEMFARELAPYNAQAHFGRNNYIEFKTDADKLHFILRWS